MQVIPDYTFDSSLHIGSKTHMLRRSMAEFEVELDPDMFCRIHRSSIDNLTRVKCLTLGEDGEHRVQLEDGTALRLSRRYQKQLRAKMSLI